MIYKFYSFNDNNISALDNYSAWFSKPKSFNDPFEGICIDNSQEMSDGEFIEFCKQNKTNTRFLNMLNNPSNIDRWLEEIYFYGKASSYKNEFHKRGTFALKRQQDYFYDSGVCCFIQEGEVNPITNSLMWGHYGDGLKGYALGVSQLHQELFEESVFQITVEYEIQPPELNSTELSIKFITEQTYNIIDETPDPLLKIMNTKHDAWKYENELRFISYEKGNRLIKYKESSIQSIYIGEKMPSWQRAALIHIAKKHNIKDIFEARVNNKSYTVNIERIINP